MAACAAWRAAAALLWYTTTSSLARLLLLVHWEPVQLRGICDSSSYVEPSITCSRALIVLARSCPGPATPCLLRAQVLGALADGVDVRGVFFWTLTDNIEWAEGMNMKFGLYERCTGADAAGMAAQGGEAGEAGASGSGSAGGEAVLREGAKVLRQLYQSWPDELRQLREYAVDQQSGGAGGVAGAVL
jgi:hypothetical protein